MPYSALIGWCIATSVSIVTWKLQFGSEEGMITRLKNPCYHHEEAKIFFFCKSLQTHAMYIHQHNTYTHKQKETKTYTYARHIPPPPLQTSHPNSCDIERLSFNLPREMQAESQDGEKCHISHSNISPLAISLDFIIHYARDNLVSKWNRHDTSVAPWPTRLGNGKTEIT